MNDLMNKNVWMVITPGERIDFYTEDYLEKNIRLKKYLEGLDKNGH